jgi:cryptochrome
MDPPPPAEPTITLELIGNSYTPLSDDHDDKYGVPNLEELGFDTDGLKVGFTKKIIILYIVM